jgi:hypothetical protein
MSRTVKFIALLTLAGCSDRPVGEPVGCGESIPCGGPPVTSGASSIAIVDELGLSGGDESSISIQARGEEGHLSYWSCRHDGPPGRGGMPTLGTCSGHRYALVGRGGRAAASAISSSLLRREVIAVGSGRETALALDGAGAPSALSLHDSGFLFHDAVRASGGWESSPTIAKTAASGLRHLVDRQGVRRAAWVEQCACPGPQACLQPCAVGRGARRPGAGAGWSTSREPLSMSLPKLLALDPDGGVHSAWIASGQTVVEPGKPPPPPPPETLLYENAAGGIESVISFEADQRGELLAIAIAAGGRAHLLFTRSDLRAQWPVPEIVYATNDTYAFNYGPDEAGGWRMRTLAVPGPRGSILPERAAFALDRDGRARVAIAGALHPGTKVVASERTLVVGRDLLGSAPFLELDADVAGDVAATVEEGAEGITWVAYFGRASVKVAVVALP